MNKNDGAGIENTLTTNKVVWHNFHFNKCNRRLLERAVKRMQTDETRFSPAKTRNSFNT